jgi:acetolactate synthase-1/2/3 large subunit
MTKVTKVIYDIISKNMSTAYLFSGGSIMSLINHFHPSNNINKMKYFVPSSEMSAGFCSLGHNKSKNNCDSVIITTSGPGLTNIITPLTDAYCDGIPLLVISGDVSTEMRGKHAFQEAPAMELTKSITYWNHLLEYPDDTYDVFKNAIDLVNNGKQVHINIPKDILSNTTNNYNYIKKYNYKNPEYSIELIKKCADIINNAKKPVLYVGRGCINANYELVQLALLANIPVTTTIHGLGLFNENHYLSLKMLGMHGSERANNAIQLADCIICIGARFDDRTVGNVKYYAPNAKNIIHINSNKSEFNKVINNTINVLGDSKNIIQALLPLIEIKNDYSWINTLKKYNVQIMPTQELE